MQETHYWYQFLLDLSIERYELQEACQVKLCPKVSEIDSRNRKLKLDRPMRRGGLLRSSAELWS